MPSPPPSSRNRSRSRSPDRRQPSGSSSAASKPRAPPKQLDIYKRSAGGRSADPLDSMPPRGSTGSSYRRSAPTDEGDYRSRADRRAGREEGGGGRAGYSSGRDDDRRGGYSDDRRGGYGGDDRDRRGGDRYRDDDRRRGDDRDSRGGSGYGRPQDRDGPPPPPSSSSSSSARPPVGLTSAPSSTTPSSAAAPPAAAPPPRAMGGALIEIIANDRLGRKVRVKCSPQDTVGDLKKLIAAQSGTDHRKIQLKKSNHIFKNHITLYDYEINDGMSLELY